MPSSRTIFGPLLVFTLAGLSIALYLRLNVDNYATKFVRSGLNEILRHGEFVADLDAANFVPGVGLEIRGLQIYDARIWGTPICESASTIVRFPTDTSSLITGNAKPTGINVQGLKLAIDEEKFRDSIIARIKEVIRNKPPTGMVPVKVRDCRVSVLRAHSRQSRVFDPVHADITPVMHNGDQALQLIVEANNAKWCKFKANGVANLQTGGWRLNVDDATLTLGDELIALLPESFARFKPLMRQAQASMAISGNIQSTSKTAMPVFEFAGKLSNGTFHEPESKTTVRECEANFQIDNKQLILKDIHGKLGDGKFQISYRQHGLWSPVNWRVSGHCENIYFHARLARYLNKSCQKFCKDFSPEGLFDLNFDMNSEGGKEIAARIADMSFSYHKFPYRISHCQGKVNWKNDDLDFYVSAIEKKQRLEFSGVVNRPGKNATYELNFGTDGRLSIDEKSINALKNFPSVERAFRDLRPNGFFNGRGKLIKLNHHSTFVQKQVRINMIDCNVRHRKFDYPVQNVQGTVELNDKIFRFNDFTGTSGSAAVRCNGTWGHNDGLELVFDCNHVDLDDRLRDALSPNMRAIWNDLRPSGKLRFSRIFLDLPIGAAYANIQLQAQLGDRAHQNPAENASIYPVWFPYQLNHLQGVVEIGNGRVSLREISGKHRKTWVSFNGRGNYDAQRWRIRLSELLAGSVFIDEEFLFALPTDLSGAIRQLNYQGQVNLSGELGFSGSNVENVVSSSSTNSTVRQVSMETVSDPVNIDWDVRLDIDQGQMTIGLPMDNIFGSVRLNGRNKGDDTQCAGKVAIDSLTIYGVQLTNIQGPIWIDNFQTQAGRFAKRESGETQSLVGDFARGKIAFDGWVTHDEQYPFFLQTTVEQSKIQDVASTLAPELRELSGDGYGFLRMQGKANELHSYHGDGSVHLRNARIHQLPVVLSLLKILSIKELNRNAFDSSNIDFSVNGDRVKLDRIELIGDAVSLIGNGYMKLLQHLDINFYTVVGRNRLYIPLVSEIYRAGSQRILWISIGGPFGNLQTSRKMLPILDDSLKALLGISDTVEGQDVTRR